MPNHCGSFDACFGSVNRWGWEGEFLEAGSRRLATLCGRLPVGKGVLERSAEMVGAAMCSAFECGAEDRWP